MFPATRLFVGRTDPTEVGGSDDDFVIAQPIDIFGRTSAARASGDAAVLRAEAELRQTLSEIQFRVMVQYAEVATARVLAESAVQSQAITQRLHDSIKVLVDEGRLPGVQLARVAIELDRAKLTVDQRSAELAARTRRLAGMLNLPESQVRISGFAEIAVARPDRQSLRSQRADLLLIQAEISAAEAEAHLARLALLPELEIQGRRTPWQESDQRFGVRIQVSVPLFEYGKAQAESKAARTLADAARTALEDATAIAEAELDAAMIELTAAQEQIQRFEAIDRATHDLVEKSRIGFAEKAVTLIEFLEGTRALREVDEGMAEARLRFAKAQAEVLLASGAILEVER